MCAESTEETRPLREFEVDPDKFVAAASGGRGSSGAGRTRCWPGRLGAAIAEKGRAGVGSYDRYMENLNRAPGGCVSTPPGSPPVPSARARALAALCCTDPTLKAAATRALFADLDNATIHPDERLEPGLPLPGRPALPRLVHAKAVPPRSPFTLEGRAALLHAVTHIEFNAINLALDAVWRFAGMPTAYYRDWLGVASEEALHFGLLREHLASIGFDYGAFDAHDGLWAMTERTAHDLTARMALVPRTLEARGLDAAPPMQAKLRKAGDLRAVAILDVILRDEIGHVAIGNRWYRWLCARDGHDPIALYAALTERYQAPRLRPPFNQSARLAAGFTTAEIELLQ